MRPPLGNDKKHDWPPYPLMKDAVSEAEVRQNAGEARLYDKLVSRYTIPTAGNRSTSETVFRFTQHTGEKFAKALAKRRLPLQQLEGNSSGFTSSDVSEHSKAVEEIVDNQRDLQNKSEAMNSSVAMPGPTKAAPSTV